jgi:hypothetical protein
MELKHRLAVAAVLVGYLLALVAVFVLPYVDRPLPID